MTDTKRQREEQALDWVRRIQDPNFFDWEMHLLWLEADDRNRQAFDDASVLMDAATEGLAPAAPLALPAPSPMNDNPADTYPGRRRDRWPVFLGGAIAASFAAFLAVPSFIPGGTHALILQTAAGHQRTVALQNGTRLMLNGDTRLRIEGAAQRVAVIERGEAYFAVRHDATNPFTVLAGTAKFQDVGTAFNVTLTDGRIDLAVREGEILYNPQAEGVRISAGKVLRIARGSATIQNMQPIMIGGWRDGKLSYRNTSLGEIVQDLSRNIGQHVSVAPELADRRFTGVVVVTPDREHMFRELGSIMRVSVQREGTGWKIVQP
jgi:transmembrane sensor